MGAADKEPWAVIGWDAFASEEYLLSHHATEAESKAAAREHLRQLELDQPSEESGGPSGIQDRVFIVGPGGVRYEYERVLDS
jgi:hypothetical protein